LAPHISWFSILFSASDIHHSHPTSAKAVQQIYVWDRFVRLFHWGLLVAVTLAALSGFWLGATWIRLHVVAGLLAASLVLLRLIWGLTGSHHARFSSFVRAPHEVLAHLRELRAGVAPRHIGHNPLGALMVLMLLAVVLSLAITGVMTLGGEFKTPPLATLSYDQGQFAHYVHKLLAWGLGGLIALHVLGALFESLRTKENLPVAMITGRKALRNEDADFPSNHSVRIRPVLTVIAAMVLFSGLAGWAGLPGGSGHPPLPHAPVSPSAFNVDYASECSDCHAAYHPSLLPGSSWQQLMAHLDDHFGEDASLEAQTAQEISDWLVTVSADQVDSKPAHVFRKVSPAHPDAISLTPFWQKTHAAIPKKTFSQPPIYGAFNCAACHADAATGWFFPSNISIPKPPITIHGNTSLVSVPSAIVEE